MKNISRILSSVICSVSLFAFDAWGVVATTSGSNLTSYNPSNAYNNQWATATNARYDGGNVSAKADFGNCNAVVLRCAQPKCNNGGCTDPNVASAIVTGCVQSNAKCKQYGADLIQYMSAQLIASSTAKANAANAEQVAAAQAAAEQAQAAAAQAQMAQQQQIAQMQSDMQRQMMEMQQQMAEQNAQSAQQIKDALAQSQQQQANAISEIRTATKNATQAEITGPMTVNERDIDAVSRGVDNDVVERAKISKRVMAEIENADAALQQVYSTMQAAFEYAGCDNRGENCSGPKRIKKWRELASGFIEPYDTVVDQILTALETAQAVGVDVSDIYMMLNDSCNSWGEYLCPYSVGGAKQIYYNEPGATNVNKSAPRVCETNQPWDQCEKCTLLRILPDAESVYQGWVNADNTTKENRTIVACASGALSTSTLFARKARARSGKGIIDIDKLSRWINQKEPISAIASQALPYCSKVE